MASTPRYGKFSQDTTVTWSDGTLFTGILYVALVPPSYDTVTDDDATEVDYSAFFPAIKIPTRIGIPIIQGKYASQLGLYYNADLVPPNSRYACKLYDSTGRSVSSMSALFVVDENPIDTLPTITPTAPTVGDNIPQPN